MTTTKQVGAWSEVTLHSMRVYENPLQDVEVKVSLTSPSGETNVVCAFWDGDDVWKARFETRKPGEWSFHSECTDTSNDGLHNITGTIEILPWPGHDSHSQTELYRRGGLSPQSKGYRLYYNDGTPFFWMADTVWNGVLKAKPEDWSRFLDIRREQGFTAVQCVMTQWRAFPHNGAGETAFTGREHIQINPNFFKGLDEKVESINRHGLVAGLVILWSCTPGDVGYYLPEEDALLLAKYIVARYGCHQVVWLLGGDGDYIKEKSEKWKRIGRAVFGDTPDRIVTMHPGGHHWVADEFRDEPWYTFVGYQSGHGDSAEYNAWLVHGLPAGEWRNNPPRPIIDLEPCYENHKSYNTNEVIGAHKVRRSLYWNLLINPTAGVTYGHLGVWPWMEERGIPMDHPWSGDADPWYEVIDSEGAQSVSSLRHLFDSADWWKFLPANELLCSQPDTDNPNGFVASALTEDKKTAFIFLPEGGTITVKTNLIMGPAIARWYNPRTGRWYGKISIDSTAKEQTFTAPSGEDWVLDIRTEL